MNEIKKNLKLLTLLAALLAGNIALVVAEENVSSAMYEEPSDEDSNVTPAREEAREQEIQAQQARELEQKKPPHNPSAIEFKQRFLMQEMSLKIPLQDFLTHLSQCADQQENQQNLEQYYCHLIKQLLQRVILT